MRVLFVDDNEMNRRVVGAMLRVAGVDMDEAANGAIGLEMIETGDYDLILMDLRMPVMDGLTAIARLRARQDDKASLPVIMVTADTGLDIGASFIARGADEVLLKPVVMNDLFDAIGRMMLRATPGAAMLG